MKKLILLELNEINFDIVQSYIKSGLKLPSFERILTNGLIETSSELIYENIEPWIQWPSVHLGLSYDEHKIFRLGDIVKHDERKQIFEKIEEKGYSVGAVSPMNASNKLKNPSYFIPDPWTKTKSDSNFFNSILSDAISQSVNDNSESKLTFKTVISLSIGFLFLVNPLRMPRLIWFAISSIKKSWRRAIFLDLLLHEIHKTLLKRNKPSFSTIFLNSGAHIQHHYFFNSSAINSSNEILKNPDWYVKETDDPLKDLLLEYDRIIHDLTKIDYDLILATGLSQVPYDKVKFYYRLANHKNFLNILGISFKEIYPRMTRDFLITFNNNDDKNEAMQKLSEITINNISLFNKIENRDKELFVTLTYPHEITPNEFIEIDNKHIYLKDHVVFVAIKNGMHSGKGYVYFSKEIEDAKFQKEFHVKEIHNYILIYFGIPESF